MKQKNCKRKSWRVESCQQHLADRLGHVSTRPVTSSASTRLSLSHSSPQSSPSDLINLWLWIITIKSPTGDDGQPTPWDKATPSQPCPRVRRGSMCLNYLTWCMRSRWGVADLWKAFAQGNRMVWCSSRSSWNRSQRWNWSRISKTLQVCLDHFLLFEASNVHIHFRRTKVIGRCAKCAELPEHCWNCHEWIPCAPVHSQLSLRSNEVCLSKALPAKEA